MIAAWDGLAKSAAEPNPFFESWYLLPALRAFDSDGAVKLVMLEADGQLVGLLPIRREVFYYGYPLPHLRSWTHANCFLGAPLVARGFEHAYWSHLLAWADSHAGLSLFLHLAHMPASGSLHLALADVLTSQDRDAATVLREERALLSSTATPETYYEAALSAKKRKELRRQHRRLEEEGNLSVERLECSEGLAAWTAQFLALEMRGWKGKAGSSLASDPRTASLFTDALRGAAERGRLQRLTLTLDSQPIAMLASFLTPPGAFSFKTAFDEDYARFSPGVLLQRENLEVLTRADIAWTDSCAAQGHPMIDHFWRERRTIARHSIGMGGPLRRKMFAALARRETGHPAKGIR
ncbi:MAG: GNAT family N-acetyltransferase [Erythrobacter sp.]|nr:MAG: GNAT family N-acetyltransferase [Erythrobacter sp.]